MELDYYQLLGVDRSATTAQIRSAYMRAMRAYHPDRAGAGGEAVAEGLNDALRTLTNREARAEYDRRLASKSDARSQSGPDADDGDPMSARPHPRTRSRSESDASSAGYDRADADDGHADDDASSFFDGDADDGGAAGRSDQPPADDGGDDDDMRAHRNPVAGGRERNRGHGRVRVRGRDHTPVLHVSAALSWRFALAATALTGALAATVAAGPITRALKGVARTVVSAVPPLHGTIALGVLALLTIGAIAVQGMDSYTRIYQLGIMAAGSAVLVVAGAVLGVNAGAVMIALAANLAGALVWELVRAIGAAATDAFIARHPREPVMLVAATRLYPDGSHVEHLRDIRTGSSMTVSLWGRTVPVAGELVVADASGEVSARSGARSMTYWDDVLSTGALAHVVGSPSAASRRR